METPSTIELTPASQAILDQAMEREGQEDPAYIVEVALHEWNLQRICLEALADQRPGLSMEEVEEQLRIFHKEIGLDDDGHAA
jgi:hypothetical protein